MRQVGRGLAAGDVVGIWNSWAGHLTREHLGQDSPLPLAQSQKAKLEAVGWDSGEEAVRGS